MKAYSSDQVAADGRCFAVRYLLDPEELHAMQAAGLVPANAVEIVGLQEVVDGLMAGFELDLSHNQRRFLQ